MTRGVSEDIMMNKLFGRRKEKIQWERLLAADKDELSIVILSSLCCNPLSYGADEGLKEAVQQVLAQIDKRAKVHVLSITDAQRSLADLRDIHRPLLNDIQSIFQSHGLRAFPALIINGKLAFYGGTPEISELRRKLENI